MTMALMVGSPAMIVIMSAMLRGIAPRPSIGGTATSSAWNAMGKSTILTTMPTYSSYRFSTPAQSRSTNRPPR